MRESWEILGLQDHPVRHNQLFLPGGAMAARSFNPCDGRARSFLFAWSPQPCRAWLARRCPYRDSGVALASWPSRMVATWSWAFRTAPRYAWRWTWCCLGTSTAQ